MPSASVKKIISCKKKDLIDMVLDIERYPEFVPWCLEGKIHEKNIRNDTIEITGDLKVGKKFINETYSSLVVYYKNQDKIIVTNINGPLKYLKNEWNFKDINNKTLLKFEIDFELKNKILNAIMKKSFVFGLNKIADKFEKRANDLFNNS
tara:strand:+ start:80 stop:529 length:450 start_codon:yes stop_codon:yes gene_type:complete